MRKEVFVWHQGALGDLVLSLPAIQSIRSISENTGLHLAARTDLSEIILLNKLADEISSNEKGLYADLFAHGNFSAPLKSFLERFSAVFIFLKKIDPVLMENFRKYIPECYQIRTRPPDDIKVHASDFQISELKKAGIAAGTQFQILKSGPLPSSGFDGKKVISIHPGSGSERKCWPLDNYLELASELEHTRRFRFFFIVGPSESSEKHKKIRDFISAKRLDADIIIGRTVSFIAGLLKVSSLYLGNDSGITHLASALGTPVIAIFGPTNPDIWGPVCGNPKIIRSASSCSPCGDDAYLKCSDERCLKGIEVEEVASEILNIV